MNSEGYSFFKELVETTNDLIVQLDNAGRLRYISPSVEKNVGIKPDLCMGKKALLFVHENDRRIILKNFAGWMANKTKKATVQTRVICVTGAVIHIRWSVHLYFDKNDSLLGFNTIGKIVAEKDDAEQVLRKKEMWDKLFSASPTWIILVTLREGAFLDFNDAFCSDTGYYKEEVVGRTSNEIGIWSDPEGRSRALSLIKEKGGLDKLPIKLKMKNGEVRNFLWSNSIIEVQNQKCLINILVDVSTLRRTEAKLAEVNKELEQRSAKLTELSTALKVLLNQKDDDKKELESNVWYNIKNMIQPHLNNLIMTRLTPSQHAHLDVIIDRLDEIASGIGERLGNSVYGLSVREMEVAGHIIAGKTNKDIAEILHISVHSVESHRFSIRKKLGLTGSRTNLRTHLLNLSKHVCC